MRRTSDPFVSPPSASRFGLPPQVQADQRRRQLVAGLRRRVSALVGDRQDGEVLRRSDPGHRVGVGLAPVAVLPARRRSGIAARLVREGLEACRERRRGFVVVLGDPAYYGRFGFLPAERLGPRRRVRRRGSVPGPGAARGFDPDRRRARALCAGIRCPDERREHLTARPRSSGRGMRALAVQSPREVTTNIACPCPYPSLSMGFHLLVQ